MKKHYHKIINISLCFSLSFINFSIITSHYNLLVNLHNRFFDNNPIITSHYNPFIKPHNRFFSNNRFFSSEKKNCSKKKKFSKWQKTKENEHYTSENNNNFYTHPNLPVFSEDNQKTTMSSQCHSCGTPINTEKQIVLCNACVLELQKKPIERVNEEKVKSFDCMTCKKTCLFDSINYHPKFFPYYYECIECFNKKHDPNYHRCFTSYDCLERFNKKREESCLNLNNISFNTSHNNNEKFVHAIYENKTPRQNLYLYAYNNYKYSKMNFSKNFKAFKKY